MHPILARSGRLGLYLLGWIPLTGLLVLLLAGSGKWAWVETLALVAPLCLLYAFVCLSAWYPVRITPVQRFGLARLTTTHLSAALLVSALWVVAGMAGARALSAIFKDFDRRFTEQIPLLFGTGVLLYLLSVALHYALLALEVSRQAEKREAEARVLARDAELNALKAQVNPHFLFNSLNSISALTSVDASRAREMCILLSEFLRSTLGLGEKPLVLLEQELALIRSFLAVEKVRFGSRLTVEEHIEDQCKKMLLPPLLLQPLVENAITHGIANLLEGGSIRLAARRAGDMLVIIIENSFDPESVPVRRNGLGLANVRKRLDVCYGAEARLEHGAAGERYSVELSLPAEMQSVEA